MQISVLIKIPIFSKNISILFSLTIFLRLATHSAPRWRVLFTSGFGNTPLIFMLNILGCSHEWNGFFFKDLIRLLCFYFLNVLEVLHVVAVWPSTVADWVFPHTSADSYASSAQLHISLRHAAVLGGVRRRVWSTLRTPGLFLTSAAVS